MPSIRQTKGARTNDEINIHFRDRERAEIYEWLKSVEVEDTT